MLKASTTYLKGKSISIVSFFVIMLTVLMVYFTGLPHHRSMILNSYISLTIIGIALFIFLTAGLYFGVALVDNFPSYKQLKKDIHFKGYDLPSNLTIPDVAIGTGENVILSILLWIGMSILIAILFFIIIEIMVISILLLIVILYWVFFRALKVVFSISARTKKNMVISIAYGLFYTLLYVGWIYAVVYSSTHFL